MDKCELFNREETKYRLPLLADYFRPKILNNATYCILIKDCVVSLILILSLMILILTILLTATNPDKAVAA